MQNKKKKIFKNNKTL